MSKYVINNVPRIRRPRNKFPRKFDVKTSLPIGRLVPIKAIEIIAGDTLSLDVAFVSRMIAPYIKTPLDSANIDISAYFIPTRLIWNKFEDYITGGSAVSSWVTPSTPVKPMYPVGTTFGEKTVFDYLGYPTKVAMTKKATALLPRMVAQVWNDFYRSEAVDDETFVQRGDYNIAEAPNTNEWSATNYSGKCPPVSKYHDYFTDCLPKPQKGTAPSVPISLTNTTIVDDGQAPTFKSSFQQASGGALIANYDGGVGPYATYDNYDNDGTNGYMFWNNPHLALSSSAGGNVSVEDLRYSFQLQRVLERIARSGSRYTEFLEATYGVSNPDSRLQRSEFLGGVTIPLGQTQVATTTEGTNQKVGDLSSFSHTQGKFHVAKAFTEHGYVIFFADIRYHHTYQQGLRKDFTRETRFEEYDPAFAFLGEAPVYATQLYAGATADRIFGYMPIFEELRQEVNEIHGEARSNATNSLDIYHFADEYANAPTLNKTFIHENESGMRRTMTLTDVTQDPFLLDVGFTGHMIRVLPLYGVPGLVDHN